MDKEEVKMDNITISILDYMAHLETINEFGDLYKEMYIEDENKSGRWIMK